ESNEGERMRPHIGGSKLSIAIGAALFGAATVASAQNVDQSVNQNVVGRENVTEIVVIAPYGNGIARERVPASIQTASAEEIERLQPLDITELLNRGFAGVSINHAQNNPLQPDVNFRGFTASPLLGLPQGLAVYQDGVRINEPFGDTVNWDLIPLTAIRSVQVVGGANPIYGLNSLGGALALETKDGFSYQGTQADVYSGSFGRSVASLQHGGHTDTFGWYANLDYFEEDGWRDFSESEAMRFMGVLSWQSDEGSALDLSLALGETDLRGNGASPAELLEIDRKQVFTHPDRTENSQVQLILNGE